MNEAGNTVIQSVALVWVYYFLPQRATWSVKLQCILGEGRLPIIRERWAQESCWISGCCFPSLLPIRLSLGDDAELHSGTRGPGVSNTYFKHQVQIVTINLQWGCTLELQQRKTPFCVVSSFCTCAPLWGTKALKNCSRTCDICPFSDSNGRSINLDGRYVNTGRKPLTIPNTFEMLHIKIHFTGEGSILMTVQLS